MSVIVNQLALPIYLDTLGTILATVLAGPVAGVVTGVLSQVVIGLQVGAFMLAFAPLQALVALLAWGVARRAGFRTPLASAAWGIATGLAAGLVSSVVSYVVFKGVTAAGVTGVTALLRGAGLPLPLAVAGASTLTDMADKAVAFSVAGAALRALPRRILARAPLAQRATGA